MLNSEITSAQDLPAEDIPAAEFLIEEITVHQRAIDSAKSAAQAILEARKQEINRWLEEAIAPEQAEIDRLSPLLQSIVERKTAGTGKKSINLPSGRAGFRSVSPTFFFHGEKADANNRLFVAEIAADGKSPFIKKKSVLDWAAMKKSLRITDDGLVCTADGELIDGLTAQIHPDQFYVQQSNTIEK